MKQKVFIIVLNYNKPTDTEECILSLKKSNLPSGTEFIIVDNSENNQSKKVLTKKFPNIHYIKSPGNLGFAGGNNLGIKYALKQDASHVLVINPDVRVPKVFLPSLLKVFKEKKRAGLVAPIHTHKQKNQKFYGYGGTVDWKLAKFTHENSKKAKYSKPKKYDFVTFACVLISREVFETVGLLDDNYFLYIEDIDYCIQTTQNGYECYIDPSIVISHATSSSFENPVSKLKFSFKSHLQFIFKWYSFPKLLLPLFYTIYFYTHLYLLWSYQHYKATK